MAERASLWNTIQREAVAAAEPATRRCREYFLWLSVARKSNGAAPMQSASGSPLIGFGSIATDRGCAAI